MDQPDGDGHEREDQYQALMDNLVMRYTNDTRVQTSDTAMKNKLENLEKKLDKILAGLWDTGSSVTKFGILGRPTF